MKKTLTIIMLLACIFTLTACGKNMNVKESDMTNELTKMGFDVNDITDSIEDSDIKMVKTANNRKYQLEYYVFKTEETAKKAYKNNANVFKARKKYKGKEKSSAGYDCYIQTTDAYYNRVERIKNKLVYVSVSLNYKSDVKKTLSKIGF